jgi:flagellum-specific peptidoglycan hydrolase FlgJ
VHTLPLPEVTDHNQETKSENGNSKLASAKMAPRASNCDLGVSADRPHLTPQQLQFLLRVAPPALISQGEYEIPACVTIAQAILESATPKFGWGSSSLFRLANNPFGIKYAHFGAGNSGLETRGAGLGTGENPRTQNPVSSNLKPGARDTGLGKEDSRSQIPNSESQISNPETRNPGPGYWTPNPESPVPSSQLPAPSTEPSAPSPQNLASKPEDYGHFDATTWEIENGQKKIVIAQFQRFPNLDEAFRAHALLLRAPRYRPAFAMRDDWKQFAERLGPKTSELDTEHCGYSTNPSYSAELIKLVGLCRLNDPRALQWFATGKDTGHRVMELSDHLAIGKPIDRSTDEPMKQSAGSS